MFQQREDAMKVKFRAFLLAMLVLVGSTALTRAQVGVIGDSNVAGKGVAASENYTAQLERALRAKGYQGTVTNAGINGDTTVGVLQRLDSDVPPGTKVVVLWVGINDRRAGVPVETIRANKAAIVARLRARGIRVVVVTPQIALALHTRSENVQQGDPQTHLTAVGYSAAVQRTLPEIEAALGLRR
jgi:acyl-CoA thioesterase I